jgi:dipeptidyl-peptidase-4
MVKKSAFVCIIAGLLAIGFAPAYSQKILTIEDIYGNPKLLPRTIRGVEWTPDGKAFTFYERDPASGKLIIKRHTLKSGKETIILGADITGVLEVEKFEKRFSLANYSLCSDGTSILIPSRNDLFLYSIQTKSLRRLTFDDLEERDPRFSPDGQKIAYLKKNNLYVLQIATGEEIQLTSQGSEDLLVGRFDWVYEEEFGIRTGFFWSPDSRYIAYFQINQTQERTFPIADFVPIVNEAPSMHYPKAGDVNGIARVGIVPAGGGKTVWMDLGPNQDIYIPRIQWLNDSSRLAMQRLNRKQNKLYLLLGDTATGKTQMIFTDEDSNGWVDYSDDWTFLKDNRHFIWLSERSNRNHLYIYDINGTPVQQITAGQWDVTRLVRVDEKRKTVYFIATEKSTIERHLYVIGLDGKGLRRLTTEEGFHAVTMPPDCDYFMDVFSNVSTPYRTSLYRNSGKQVRILEPGTIRGLEDYDLAAPEFFTMSTDDGLELNAYIMKPVDFDPAKKYPVLINTYPGPGAQVVQNNWNSGKGSLWHQLMLQNGYLIFAVDGRGTGFRGNHFKNMIYRNLGIGITDQINGAKYLRSLPYVDGSRIGIWGWSGGGWGTCMALTLGAGYFKAGVAVASVTDFRNYDTIWTERYMDLPQNNPEGYAASNPMEYIDIYRGGLLLIHGSSDDNVHLSNTLQFAYALQNARKPFEMMIYPRKLHGIGGSDTRIHLFTLITDFFMKNL